MTNRRPAGFRLARRHVGAAVLAAALAAAALALPHRALAVDPVFNTDGVAIEGTDPVAYFTEGKPVQGKPEFTYSYQGVTWRFASAANRDAFAAEPARYAPQYGGYCAFAVAQGATAPTVAEAWHIEDGKLYLNFSKSVQRQWLQDIPGYVVKADRNWPKLKAGN